MMALRFFLAKTLMLAISNLSLAQWTTTAQFSSINIGNSDTQYPTAYNVIGNTQLSIGANWTSSMTDLSLINSNIANTTGGGFTFWQMMSANSKKLLAYMKGDGSIGFGGIIPTRALEVRGINPIFRIGNYTPQNTQVNKVIGGIEFPTSGENYWMAKINANVGQFSDQPYLTFHTGAASAEQVRITQDGNVGIGTPNPLARLHVTGNFRQDLGNYSQGWPGTFSVDAGGVAGGRFIISTGGNVGIGNPSPPTTLSVNGEIYSKGHMFLYAYEGEFSSGTAYLQARNLALPIAGIPTDIDLQVRTQKQGNVIEAMRVKANGNVGIGTTTPSARLEVAGEIRSTAGKFSSIYSTNTDGQYPTTYANTIGDAQLSIGANWTSGMTDLSLINSNIANTSGGGFSFWQMTGASSKKMLAYLNGDGSMGIGTQFPGAYKLAVEGKIGAREVEVKIGSWADFVFAKDYTLPSLQEVEAHINEKQHLPGIPSEAEVKENGIGLGEMNAKLLQKIEELTLYVIQLQKQVDQLKVELGAKKMETNALKHR